MPIPNIHKYQTRQIQLEAVQWNPDSPAGAGVAIDWLMGMGVLIDHPTGAGRYTTLRIIETGAIAYARDWIVKDEGGAIMPISNDAFTRLCCPIGD